jgi:hypothetical protein
MTEHKPNSPCKGCKEREVPRIKDDDCLVVVYTVPVSPDQAIVTIQFKDKSMLRTQIEPGKHLLMEQDGIFTLALFETPSSPIELSEILTCPRGKHRAHGSGGVWNSWPPGCESRECDVSCRDAGCDSVINICKRRFDSPPCSSVVACYAC